MSSNHADQRKEQLGISTYPVVVSSVVESFMYGNVDCNMKKKKQVLSSDNANPDKSWVM